MASVSSVNLVNSVNEYFVKVVDKGYDSFFIRIGDLPFCRFGLFICILSTLTITFMFICV